MPASPADMADVAAAAEGVRDLSLKQGIQSPNGQGTYSLRHIQSPNDQGTYTCCHMQSPNGQSTYFLNK